MPVPLAKYDIERLQKADALIVEVMEKLEVGAVECSKCGMTRYKDWDHYNLNQTLGGARGRLEKAMRWIQNKLEETADGNQ
jgi:hypothetical protein